MMVFDRLKVRMVHCVFGCHTLGMVVLKHLGKQIDCFVCNQLVVLGSDELGPWFARVIAENVVVVGVQLHVVLFNISIELLSA